MLIHLKGAGYYPANIVLSLEDNFGQERLVVGCSMIGIDSMSRLVNAVVTQHFSLGPFLEISGESNDISSSGSDQESEAHHKPTVSLEVSLTIFPIRLMPPRNLVTSWTNYPSQDVAQRPLRL